jgi:hypothetical protein
MPYIPDPESGSGPHATPDWELVWRGQGNSGAEWIVII